MNRTRLITVSLLILAAAAERIIAMEAGLWNFAPVGALALFGGAMFGKRLLAFLLPLSALLLSDIILGFRGNEAYQTYMSGGEFLINYGSYPLVILIGTLLHNRISVPKLALATISGSIVFFILSNFFVWLTYETYTKSFSGLMQCYELALPFFKSTVISDFAFVTALFGSYYLISLRLPVLRKA